MENPGDMNRMASHEPNGERGAEMDRLASFIAELQEQNRILATPVEGSATDTTLAIQSNEARIREYQKRIDALRASNPALNN